MSAVLNAELVLVAIGRRANSVLQLSHGHTIFLISSVLARKLCALRIFEDSLHFGRRVLDRWIVTHLVRSQLGAAAREIFCAVAASA